MIIVVISKQRQKRTHFQKKGKLLNYCLLKEILNKWLLHIFKYSHSSIFCMPDCKCKILLITFPTKEQNSDENIAQSNLKKALVKLPFSSRNRGSNILTVCSLVSETEVSLRLLKPEVFELDLFSLFDLNCCTVHFFV